MSTSKMIQQATTKSLAKYAYPGPNVLEASKLRWAYLFDHFDDIWYAYSGGKDSLAVISLAKEMHKLHGWPKPNVFFTDEELIPDEVIASVCKEAESGDYNFRYFAPTMTNRKFLMGKQEDYITFDPDREWVRNPPSYAIRLENTRNMDQWQINEAYFPEYGDTGMKVALVLGIRAEESLMRLASVSMVSNDGTPNWVSTPPNKRFQFCNCKPIYDWSEIDIFKYFYDEGIEYCKVYDAQVWTKVPLRVSTPLHEMSSQQLPQLKRMHPVFYAQMVSIFPDIEAHCRYWKDYDKKDIIMLYERSFDGIRAFIHDRFAGDPDLDKTMKYVDDCESARGRFEKAGKHASICYGYPIKWVFQQVLTGKWGKEGSVPIPGHKFKPEYTIFEDHG